MKLLRVLLLVAALCGALIAGCSSTPDEVHSPDDFKGSTTTVEE